MKRLEYKYLVPIEELTNLRRALSPFIEADTYMPSDVGEYCVHSIYLDTLSLDCYYEKLAGIQHRKKIRIRGYNNQDCDTKIFLEIKRKDDKYVSKNRAPLYFKHIGELFACGNIEKYILNGNGSQGAYDDARRFFYHVYRNFMFPVIGIHYDREAYFRKFNDSMRITFDKNLRSLPYPKFTDLFKDAGTLVSLKGYFILEIKFHDMLPNVPEWLGNILEKFGLIRTSVSKYTICLDAQLIPEKSPPESACSLSTIYNQ